MSDAPTPQTNTDDLRAQVADLVRKADRNPHRVAKQLLQRIAVLEEKLEKAVPAGAVVLTGDDAKAWDAFKALGQVDEVRAKIGEADTLRTQLAARDAAEQRRKVAREGAVALGMNPDAVEAFASDKGLTLEMREVEVDDGKGGREKRMVLHTIAGEGDAAKAEPFDVVAKRDHAIYLPALTAKSDTPAHGAGGNGTGGTTPTFTYPAHRAGGAASSGDDPAAQFIEKMNKAATERPNPLLTKATA